MAKSERESRDQILVKLGITTAMSDGKGNLILSPSDYQKMLEYVSKKKLRNNTNKNKD